MTGTNPNDHAPESFDYLEDVDMDLVPDMVAANEGFLAKLWECLGWLLDHRDRPRPAKRARPP